MTYANTLLAVGDAVIGARVVGASVVVLGSTVIGAAVVISSSYLKHSPSELMKECFPLYHPVE